MLGVAVTVLVVASGAIVLVGASIGTYALSATVSMAIGSAITVSGAQLTILGLTTLVAGFINAEYILPEIPYENARGVIAEFNKFGMIMGFSGLMEHVGKSLGDKYTKWQNKGTESVSADNIEFSDKFSKPGYENQVSDRGWSNQKIANTINNPYKTADSINTYTGNPVKVYYVDETHYVAVDAVTNKVIQVSDLFRTDWIFDLFR